MNPSISGNTLVQINKPAGRCPATWHERAASGPIVDKFFALGAIFGIAGTLGYGLYLWLVLNNLAPLVGSYPGLRRAHAIIQVFLFFGLFVLGFISQAGGKMLGANLKFGKKPLMILPLYLLGGIALLSGQSWGAFFISAPFLIYACYVGLVCIRNCQRPPQAALTVLGLGVLAASPFLSFENPSSALLIMWGGFGSLIFSASVQFLSAFLGGSTLSGKSAIGFLMLHSISVVFLVFSPTISAEYIAISALASTFVYLYATGFSKWSLSFYPNPLGLAFVAAYLWALGAWGILLQGSYVSLDLTVHILATGWAAPLIFAVSSQVIGFLTGKSSLLPRKLWWTLLLLWQLVPLGRGAFHIFGLPAWFALIVALVSTIVMLSWATGICRAEWTMLRLQSVLKKGEALKSCG